MEREQREALETEWAQDRERAKTQKKQKQQEAKVQREKQQQEMNNVCVSARCTHEKKKKCTFGMCIACCKLRPGAGTLEGKCNLGTHYPGPV